MSTSSNPTDDLLEELTTRAEARWGAERLGALRPALENAASALRRLQAAPLDLLQEEPDFVGGTPPGAL